MYGYRAGSASRTAGTSHGSVRRATTDVTAHHRRSPAGGLQQNAGWGQRAVSPFALDHYARPGEPAPHCLHLGTFSNFLPWNLGRAGCCCCCLTCHVVCTPPGEHAGPATPRRTLNLQASAPSPAPAPAPAAAAAAQSEAAGSAGRPAPSDSYGLGNRVLPNCHAHKPLGGGLVCTPSSPSSVRFCAFLSTQLGTWPLAVVHRRLGTRSATEPSQTCRVGRLSSPNLWAAMGRPRNRQRWHRRQYCLKRRRYWRRLRRHWWRGMSSRLQLDQPARLAGHPWPPPGR